MRILIDMGHPGHVHFFKNFIWEMEKRGHEIKVTARDKEVTKQLLDAYNIPYQLIGKPLPRKIGLMREWILRGYAIYKTGKKFNADLYLGILNPATALSAKLSGKKSFTFTDTEHATFAKSVTFPFTDRIITPSCYLDDLGEKQVRYNGYHELAYLHPKYFRPDPSILNYLNLERDEPFIILRFVSWNASHDKNQFGIRDKVAFVRSIEKYGRVFITSEMDLPVDLKPYVLKIPPENLHDLLAFASLYIGEGATTASECAVLGTHALYTNTLQLGYTYEEQHKYGLVYNYFTEIDIQKNLFRKTRELMENRNLKLDGWEKRKRLLQDKIDPTAFIISFVENESFRYFE